MANSAARDAKRAAVAAADPDRAALVEALFRVGREHSTATVLFHSAVSARLGLTATDEKTLDLLERLGPLTPGQLSQHTGLASASVTSLVDRLERRGFVRRVRSDVDRRSITVELAPDSAAAILPLFESFSHGLRTVLASYSDAELAVVLDFMCKTAELARAETEKLAPAEPA